MIIFNTTFHVDEGHQVKFIKYLKTEYIPMAVADGRLKNPRLLKVNGEHIEKGHSFALEFSVESLENLQNWNEQIGKKIYNVILSEFEQKVVGFATILNSINID